MSSLTSNPPGQRELVYCHLCRDEWYRDEHGLVCPHCGGDFVEIVRTFPLSHPPLHRPADISLDPQIENTNDPRNPAGHNPNLPEDFGVESDDEGGPAATVVRINGPNFSFTSTQRNFGSRTQHSRGATAEAGVHSNPDDMILELFTNMLRNIVGDASAVGVGGATSGTPGASAEQGQTTGTGPTRSPVHPHTPMPSIFGTPPPVFRWPYDPSARLNPRDANSPQPHEETVLDLPTYVFIPHSSPRATTYAN